MVRYLPLQMIYPEGTMRKRSAFSACAKTSDYVLRRYLQARPSLRHQMPNRTRRRSKESEEIVVELTVMLPTVSVRNLRNRFSTLDDVAKRRQTGCERHPL